ncbi:MAG: alpha/beta hydrolase family protein [Granulosicoccus sp.]|nr:alpha/beta hydrolase family protein [Granulosicoccus sp.]
MTSRASVFGVFLFTLVTSIPLSAHADELPDYDREARIAEQIEPQVFDGEVIWLNDGERDFLSIYTEADSPRGSVIVMHGRDVNPEDLNVAGPVRVALAENGWSTLAIQLPVLAKGKKYYDYLPILDLAGPRIEAAIDYLREQGNEKVVIAAHSCGAHMANNWLNQHGDDAIDGYIAMGLGATDSGQELKTLFPIGNMRVPVLDIYGENEFPRPLAMVEDRLSMLSKNGHPDSTQIVLEDADHYFADAGDRLAEKILEWLDTAKLARTSSD